MYRFLFLSLLFVLLIGCDKPDPLDTSLSTAYYIRSINNVNGDSYVVAERVDNHQVVELEFCGLAPVWAGLKANLTIYDGKCGLIIGNVNRLN